MELADILLFYFTRLLASLKRIKLTIVNTITEEHVISPRMSLVRLLILGTSELAPLPNLKCMDQFHEFRDHRTIRCDIGSSASVGSH